MSKIKIISDSAADIRYETIEKYGIKILPINLYFGDELYRDYFDIKFEEFYKKLAAENDIPKTSQISPTVFYDAYKEAADEGFDTVLCFTLSKAGSGTYNNANLAANMLHDEGVELDIAVVDTMSYCFMYGRAVEIAAEMAAAGAEPVVLDMVQSTDLEYDDSGLLTGSKDEHGILKSTAAKQVKLNRWQHSNAEEILSGFDCIVFPGGSDISPTLYYKEQGWHGIEGDTDYSAERDVSDYLLMTYCLDEDIPMLCICRGMQMLAVVSGADMIQDVGQYLEKKGL